MPERPTDVIASTETRDTNVPPQEEERLPLWQVFADHRAETQIFLTKAAAFLATHPVGQEGSEEAVQSFLEGLSSFDQALVESLLFLRDPLWGSFQNEVALKEFYELRPSERAWIERMTHALVQETDAVRALETWPIGADLSGPVEAVSGDIFTHPDVRLDWRARAAELERLLTPSEKEVFHTTSAADTTVFVTTKGALQQKGYGIVIANLITPAGSVAWTNEALPHRFVFFTQLGEFYRSLQERGYIHLLPFVFKAAIARLNPAAQVYVDGSLSGGNGLYGYAPQGGMIMMCGNAEWRVTYQPEIDFRWLNQATPPQRVAIPTDDQLFAKIALGKLTSPQIDRGPLEQIDFACNTTVPPVSYPRLQRGDTRVSDRWQVEDL